MTSIPLPERLADGLKKAIRRSESAPSTRSSSNNLELLISPYKSIKGANIHLRLKEGNHETPHVHVDYGNESVSISIESQEILAGSIPRKQLNAAKKYISSHSEDFLQYWNDVKNGKNPKSNATKSNDKD